MSVQTWIEGERDEGLAQRVAEGSAVLQDTELEAQLGKERVLIDLLSEEDSEQFIDRYQRSLHVRCGIDWNEYRADSPQSRTQRLLAGVRGGMLRMLRPALEWLTFRQSAVNSQFTFLLMDERLSRIAAEDRLKDEISELRHALKQQNESFAGGDR